MDKLVDISHGADTLLDVMRRKYPLYNSVSSRVSRCLVCENTQEAIILDHPKSTVWPRVIVTSLLFSVVLCITGRCDVMVLED